MVSILEKEIDVLNYKLVKEKQRGLTQLESKNEREQYIIDAYETDRKNMI